MWFVAVAGAEAVPVTAVPPVPQLATSNTSTKHKHKQHRRRQQAQNRNRAALGIKDGKRRTGVPVAGEREKEHGSGARNERNNTK